MPAAVVVLVGTDCIAPGHERLCVLQSQLLSSTHGPKETVLRTLRATILSGLLWLTPRTTVRALQGALR